MLEHQTLPRKHVEHVVLSACDVALRQRPCGRVNQSKQPLGARVFGRGVVLAVLRANVDRGRITDALLLEDRIKLLAVVVAEQHRVVRERKTRHAREHAPGDRRQRTPIARQFGHGALRILTEQPFSKRSHVAIEHHGIAHERLTVRELHTRDAPVVGQQSRHGLEVTNRNAILHGRIGQRPCEPDHAPLDVPDAGALGVRDELQCCGCAERRRAAVGRVAREQLHEPRVAKAFPEIVKERDERSRREQVRDALEPDARRKFGRRRSLRAHEGKVECLENLGRVAREVAVGLGVLATTERTNSLHTALHVSEQIKLAAIAPAVPREQVGLTQGHVCIEVEPDLRKQVVENPAHREYGRTRIDAAPVDLDLAHLAARVPVLLEHGDANAAR